MEAAPAGVSRRGAVGGALVALACLAAAARAAPLAARTKIACVGDSMADGLWGGLARLAQREACLSNRIEFCRYGRNGTGLARGDLLDWTRELASILAQDRPTLLLVSLGLNDHQQIVAPPHGRVAYGAREWTDAYRARIESFLTVGAQTEAGLVWLGNPVMRDPVMQSRTAQLNALVAEAIAGMASAKAVYLAPWRLAAEGDESYRQYGAAASGARTQLRAADGVHFTPAGYDLVADHVTPSLLARLQAAKIDIAYPCLRLG
jgi:hypothetical protein